MNFQVPISYSESATSKTSRVPNFIQIDAILGLNRDYRISYFEFSNSDSIFEFSDIENRHLSGFIQIGALSDKLNFRGS